MEKTFVKLDRSGKSIYKCPVCGIQKGEKLFQRWCHITWKFIDMPVCIKCKNVPLDEHKRIRGYDLTKEQYHKLFDAQNNKCAICSTEFSLDNIACIDHCHKTNVVRGLLCTKCNTGLGMFNDNQDLLYMAIDYLKAK